MVLLFDCKVNIMKKILYILIIILLISCSVNNQNEITINKITSDQALEDFNNKTGYIIVDVRTKQEFDEAHIPGAINIPNEEIIDTKPEELPDLNQEIYIYCRSGNRSNQAAIKLNRMGYTNIYDFGGIIDWKGDIE